MGVSETSDHTQIKIKMPNPNQEPPASSKATNKNLKDMDVLCPFNVKKEGQNFDLRFIKTSDHIQIIIKITNPSQEPPASSKATNKDLKDMDVFAPSKSR